MSDAPGSSEALNPPPPPAARTANPDAAAVAAHPWGPVMERLRQAGADEVLREDWPKMAERITRLLNEEDAGGGAKLDDPWFKTRVAYVVSDIDRITGRSLPIPPDVRSEIDLLAVTSPGLRHDGLTQLLRQTSSMGSNDLRLIQEIRHQARQFVETGIMPESRIVDLEARVIRTLGGPDAPPPATAPRETAPTSAEPAPRSPQGTPQAAPAPPAAVQPEPASWPPARAPEPAAPAPQAAPAVTQVAMPMSRASALMAAIAPRSQSAKPPPWQGPQQGLAGRLAQYETAQADRYTQDLHQRADSSASATVKALATLETGPAADVMRKIRTEAASDPNGAAGVIQTMRPGGKHEGLRNEYNAVLVHDRNFGDSLDRSKATMGHYLADRDALEKEYRRRGWNLSDLDHRLASADRAIADAAERIPGRESGKSLTDELAEKAMKMAQNLIERVKRLIERPAAGVAPGTAPRMESAPP